MDQLTLYSVQNISTLLFENLPWSLGTTPAHTSTPFEPNTAYVVREDNGEPKLLINIFDLLTGEHCFTISRGSTLSTQWYMYAEPEHVEVARITMGGFGRRVDVLNNSVAIMKYNSGILGKFHRHFYDNKGNQFSWNRRSKYLEKIINPGGKHEETRERVGVVDHLRPGWFDWEVRLDTSQVDLVTGLVTAFVTMKTQWPLYGRVSTPGYGSKALVPPNAIVPRALNAHPPKPKPESNGVEPKIETKNDEGPPNKDLKPAFASDIDQFRVFKETPKPDGNFFDPPEFLKYKYHYNL